MSRHFHIQQENILRLQQQWVRTSVSPLNKPTATFTDCSGLHVVIRLHVALGQLHEGPPLLKRYSCTFLHTDWFGLFPEDGCTIRKKMQLIKHTVRSFVDFFLIDLYYNISNKL